MTGIHVHLSSIQRKSSVKNESPAFLQYDTTEKRKTPPAIVRCRENGFTEFLPSNYKVYIDGPTARRPTFLYYSAHSLLQERFYRAVA